MSDLIYKVIRNTEGSYTLMLAHSPCPPGWEEVGFEGTQQECLTHIDKVWTDMLPNCVREQLHTLQTGCV